MNIHVDSIVPPLIILLNISSLTASLCSALIVNLALYYY